MIPLLCGSLGLFVLLVLPDFVGQDQHDYLVASAPLPPFAKPVLEVRNERIEDGRRILDCRLNSPRDAQRLWIRVESGEVHAAAILGHDLEGGGPPWEARFEILCPVRAPICDWKSPPASPWSSPCGNYPTGCQTFLKSELVRHI